MRHRHHIVPRHAGGDDDSLNVMPPISVRLHAAMHYDRWRMLREVGDYIAWMALSGNDVRAQQAYAAAQTSLSVRAKKSKSMKGNKNGLGVKHSAESIARRTAKVRGQKRSVESRDRMRQAHLGHTHTSETRAKMAARMRGNAFARGSKRQIEATLAAAEKNRGRKRSLQARQHISEAMRGNHNRSRKPFDAAMREGADALRWSHPGASESELLRLARAIT